MRLDAAILAVLLFCLAACDRAPPTDWNVVLITVDTLRADHLSAYGYDRETSPRIDALARDGVRFRHTIVPRGQTWPTIASLFTSLHPRSHGVRENGYPLAEGTLTLTRLLKRAGYTTAAFLTNMITAKHRDFDHLERFVPGDRDAAALREVLPWLGRHRDERFFLWVHLVGPHDPYVPAQRFAERFNTGYRGPIDGGQVLRRVHRKRTDLPPKAVAHVVSLYDGEIAQVDERIGAILDEIDAQGLRASTLVVLTSDHGEELYQHNHFFLHAWSIYDSVLRVPLVLRLPGVLPAGKRVDGVIRIEDVAPTILELVGVTTPESFEGESLLPAIRAGSADSSRFVISELGPGIVSLRSDRWHYIYNPKGYSSPATIDGDRGDRGLFQIETEELYDVARDPRETRNLAADRPEVAAELRERAERWLAEDESDFQPYDVNPQLLEELRAMGYVD